MNSKQPTAMAMAMFESKLCKQTYSNSAGTQSIEYTHQETGHKASVEKPFGYKEKSAALNKLWEMVNR